MSQSTDLCKAEATHHEHNIELGGEIDTEAEKRLVRKIDLFLMPSVFILYILSYMDRSNIGLAKIAGMEEDLELSSNEYYIAVVVWVIGYTAAAVPSNMILSRARPSYFIPIITFAWGTVAALLGVVSNSTQLTVLRLLLGIFEGGFSPAVIFLISTWYRKCEQSKRFIIFLSAGILSGAFGGVVSGSITSSLDGVHGIQGWRWLFIVEGITTVGVSVLSHWTLLDYPHNSRGLNQAERDLAQKRMVLDGIAETHANSETPTTRTSIFICLLEAMSNWRTWLLVPGYMSILGALALSYFYPTLVEGMGYSSTNAQYMTAPLYLVSPVVAVPVCYFADRKPHLRGTILVLNLTVGMVFFALTAAIQHYTARYIFLCVTNVTIWTGNALALSFATTGLASVDQDVRAIMLATMNGVGALAQLYGSALFPEKDGPQYVVAFSVFAGTFAAGAIFYGLADTLFKRYP